MTPFLQKTIAFIDAEYYELVTSRRLSVERLRELQAVQSELAELLQKRARITSGNGGVFRRED